MASVNKVILVGNLGKDPESRVLANGDAVCNITIATSESWKDKNTGEILISDVVYKIFKQYQYAQNFLNTKEFEVGSPEHSVGKLMMLYPKFCEFMMHTAQMQQEGKEIYDFEGNYNKAVNDAIKYVEKRKDLFDLYENFWSF